MLNEFTHLIESRRRSLRVVVVFDNYESGVGAVQLFREFLNNRSTHGSLHTHFWSLAELFDLELLGLASGQSREADVLLVAVDGAHPLPKSFTRWMRGWQGRTKPGLLAVVMRSVTDSGFRARRLLRFLQRVAENHQMHFLARPGAAEDWRLACAERLNERALQRTGVLNDILKQPMEIWPF